MKALIFCVLAMGLLALPATAQPIKIVVLGDSLVAGYGLPPGEGFVPQLQKALDSAKIDAEIINAGVAGDTSSQGLARLDWSVPEDAAGVILELGANDALRAQDPASTEKALDEALTRLKARGLPVLLAGMRAPPNLGPDYSERFDAIYPRLAQKHAVGFYPFFLDGVAGERALNQPDGMHPTREGVALIVERMLPAVKALVAEAARTHGAD